MKKAGRKLLIAAVVLIIFGVMAYASCSSSSKKDKPKKVGKVDENGVEVTAGDGDEEVEEIQDEYHVGDILQTSEFKIVYIASGVYVEDNQYLQPEEGKQFVFFKFYVENISDEEHTISYFSFDGFADGYSVSLKGCDEELSATLSPGRTTTGMVCFEVPKDASVIETEYEYDLWNDGRVTFVYDGDKDSGYVPDANTTATADAFVVGDIVETSELRITYLSCSEYTSDNQFIQPADGNRFISFELEFENITDKDQHISSYSFDCYADGSACQQHYVLDDSVDATLSSGRKASGLVIFEVPENATTIELEYTDGFINGNRMVFSYSE